MDDIEDLHAPDGGGPRRPASTVQLQRRPQPSAASLHPLTDDDIKQPTTILRPGLAKIWVRTFGCSHNQSDGEYMLGQLAEHGYTLVDDAARDAADVWIINSCTVKSPSQSAMANLLASGRDCGKRLLVAGCVPQGDKGAPELQGLSLLGGFGARVLGKGDGFGPREGLYVVDCMWLLGCTGDPCNLVHTPTCGVSLSLSTFTHTHLHPPSTHSHTSPHPRVPSHPPPTHRSNTGG